MNYENNWESLNSRPVPEWFADAKFGIFIHWGLYSVPAYAPKGDYAEWYGYSCNLETPEHPSHPKYKEFHKKHYNSRPYFDFLDEFTGYRFDAKKWAELFERSGAKYINFVSKHHDGYCLYETEYAPGLNSVECAPKRDFLMELKNAMEGTGVRFGVYHSVYEWWHPYYLEDPEKYALEHLHPMLKELIEKYQPNTLFTDGEWAHESSVWHSTEFLQWLYNESSVKDFIVPNDRWGKETRGKLGGNFTTEYGIIDVYLGTERRIEDVELDRPFEECRGIGRSFGINKEEQCEDYLSAKELLETLCDLVSKGGNFLLNIGPDADGTIPVIMEERLLQMGDWLRVNGEAIYGTRIYTKKLQNGVYYTKKGDAVYAIINRFPFGSQVLNEVEYSADLKAILLGCDAVLEVKDNGGKAEIVFPAINPDNLDSNWLYTIKITK